MTWTFFIIGAILAIASGDANKAVVKIAYLLTGAFIMTLSLLANLGKI